MLLSSRNATQVATIKFSVRLLLERNNFRFRLYNVRCCVAKGRDYRVACCCLAPSTHSKMNAISHFLGLADISSFLPFKPTLCTFSLSTQYGSLTTHNRYNLSQRFSSPRSPSPLPISQFYLHSPYSAYPVFPNTSQPQPSSAALSLKL